MDESQRYELKALRCLKLIPVKSALGAKDLSVVIDNVPKLYKLSILYRERDTVSQNVAANAIVAVYIDVKKIMNSSMPDVAPLTNLAVQKLNAAIALSGLSFDEWTDTSAIENNADGITSLCDEAAKAEGRRIQGSSGDPLCRARGRLRRELETVGLGLEKKRGKRKDRSGEGSEKFTYRLAQADSLRIASGHVRFKVHEIDVCIPEVVSEMDHVDSLRRAADHVVCIPYFTMAGIKWIPQLRSSTSQRSDPLAPGC